MAALPEEITGNLDGIRALCVTYGVKRLTLFGSAARGEFDPQTSDFDFLVEFLPETRTGLRFFAFEEDLAALLGRRVDLMSIGPIRNPYLRKHIEDNPIVPLYEAA
jgi:predicted nucleotidyltransferase